MTNENFKKAYEICGSYRKMQQATGIDHSTLSKISLGKRPLTANQTAIIDKFVQKSQPKPQKETKKKILSFILHVLFIAVILTIFCVCMVVGLNREAKRMCIKETDNCTLYGECDFYNEYCKEIEND